MKILWLINIMLPQVSVAIGEKITNTGGWLISLSKKVPEENELVICYPDRENRELELDGVSYYGIVSMDKKENIQPMKEHFLSILKNEKPDVIHIWGTEHLHSYALAKAAKEIGCAEKLVVSIQGLVSIYAQHYMAGLPAEIQLKKSPRDIIRKDSLQDQMKAMEWKGEYEEETLRMTSHVIGRTTWDKFCAMQMNPALQYHFNNEILRDSFYENEWKLEECERHSIFVSQAQYPIKGFHFVLQGAAILREKYPDLKIYVAGHRNPFAEGYKAMEYNVYLSALAKKYGVEEMIHYVGSLDEEEMCRQYLKAHVYVNASSIENSPNSVGEAMLLGVPTVASNVGGTSDMLKDKDEGFLYPYDAPYMMAGYVDEIFSDDELVEKVSAKARRHAMLTHDRDKNYRELIDIYRSIVNV